MNIHKPLILVTNDDGITAPGIRALIEVMRTLGEVVVVAPDQGRSGQAHAITVNVPLRPKLLVAEKDYTEYQTNGTPVDCVKLAIKALMPRKPDLLVSGINHGTNSSINIVYSGTMAATIEGCMEAIPSIGFSLGNFAVDANFAPSLPFVKLIAEKVLAGGLPHGVCLNVNIPDVKEGTIRGIKTTRQGTGTWTEEFDHRVDPRGRDYYWITGQYNGNGSAAGTDEWALANHYISITPVTFDLTAHQALDTLTKQFDR